MHFLENHDEPRVAGRLDFPAHRAASLLILTLPGMGFLHDGQLEGARTRASVHLRRRVSEPVDERVAAWYAGLLQALRVSRVGLGSATILRPVRVGSDPVADQLVAICWRSQGGAPGFDLVVVNVTSTGGSCILEVAAPPGPVTEWRLESRLSFAPHASMPVRATFQQRNRLLVEVPPYGVEWWNLSDAV